MNHTTIRLIIVIRVHAHLHQSAVCIINNDEYLQSPVKTLPLSTRDLRPVVQAFKHASVAVVSHAPRTTGTGNMQCNFISPPYYCLQYSFISLCTIQLHSTMYNIVSYHHLHYSFELRTVQLHITTHNIASYHYVPYSFISLCTIQLHITSYIVASYYYIQYSFILLRATDIVEERQESKGYLVT